MKLQKLIKNRRCKTLMLIGLSCHCSAVTYQVDTTLDQTDVLLGDGLCKTINDQCSLRAAIQESNQTVNTDVILVPGGDYLLGIPGIDEDQAATGDLDLLQPVVIIGDSAELTTIYGQQLDRVFEVFPQISGDDTQLSDLTVTGGQYSEFNQAAGSALLIRGHDINLNRVNLIGNQTLGSGAAAVHISDSCLRGTQVRITNNTGEQSSGTVFIEGNGSCLELDQFEISHNETDSNAAIFFHTSAVATLKNGLIAHNKSRTSTIVLNSDNQVTFNNVTISSNQGNSAILNDGFSQLFFIHSTITKNTGSNGGQPVVGGIQDVHGGTGMVFLTNSIVAGNGPGFLADDISRANSLNGGNLIGDAVGYAAEPSDHLNVVLNLGNLQNLGGFTQAHEPDIQWVDLANDSFCNPYDQRAVTSVQEMVTLTVYTNVMQVQ